MKKALFCVMLIAASLISGWCLADFKMYCSKTLANQCMGSSDAVTEDGVFVKDCMLNNSKRYICKQGNTSWWWCTAYACEGETAIGGVPCTAVSGTKGCLTPMFD